MKNLFILLATPLLFFACKSEIKKEDSTLATNETEVVESTPIQSNFEVTPISHATMVLEWDGKVLYIDPVGGAKAFEGQPAADLILVTDIHGDHLNVETLQAVSSDKSKIIVPQAVADKLPAEFDAQVDVLNNGETKVRFGFMVEAVPMYNLREEALKFHEKGRGNGYVIEKDGKRVYISGDTEDIPEMRALKNIDAAFVCMNLPYTMTVDSAASAVAEFAPKTVYPYHYRGTEGLSDVDKFSSLLKGQNAAVEIKRLDWYPQQ